MNLSKSARSHKHTDCCSRDWPPWDYTRCRFGEKKREIQSSSEVVKSVKTYLQRGTLERSKARLSTAPFPIQLFHDFSNKTWCRNFCCVWVNRGDSASRLDIWPASKLRSSSAALQVHSAAGRHVTTRSSNDTRTPSAGENSHTRPHQNWGPLWCVLRNLHHYNIPIKFFI